MLKSSVDDGVQDILNVFEFWTRKTVIKCDAGYIKRLL
jgi:hypothetical protein